MPLHVSPMTDDLRRQRRNLLVYSFLLWFKKFAGITVGNVMVLGTSFTFERTDAIDIAIWVLWVYSLVRFIEYFREDGLPKLNEAATGISIVYFPGILRQYVDDNAGKDVQGTCTYEMLEKKLFRRTFKGGIFNVKTGFPDPVEIDIPFKLWAKDRFYTYLQVSIHTSVTDYFFPWIVAVVVFAYYTVG